MKTEQTFTPWRAVESGPGMDGISWSYRIESGPPAWTAIHVLKITKGKSTGTLAAFKQIAFEHNCHNDLLEACKLLLAGAKAVRLNGVMQPQLNGGVVLAEAALSKATKGAP